MEGVHLHHGQALVLQDRTFPHKVLSKLYLNPLRTMGLWCPATLRPLILTMLNISLEKFISIERRKVELLFPKKNDKQFC